MILFRQAVSEGNLYEQNGELWHLRVPKWFSLVFLAALTAFFGELKMTPFGEPFRFSLGTAFFFFGLIWLRELSPLWAGIFTGVYIAGFRILLGYLFFGIPFGQAWTIHFPSAIFYIVFSLVIQLFRVRQKLEQPLWMGLAGTAAEVAGNLAELLLRTFLNENLFSMRHVAIIVLFGILRSFFVVGIYTMFTIRQVRFTREQQRKRIDSLLLVNSGLFEEAVFLKKSMENMEEVTRRSYTLYGNLRQGTAAAELAPQALQLAQQIHELKKDSQRILAGLSKMMKTENLNMRMKVAALIGLVARTNQNYAEMLQKDIVFHVDCHVNLETDQLYPLLSILNNLVANSVEAIESNGEVGIEVSLAAGQVGFTIWDTGPGIPHEEQDWIFHVGYTTKFDLAGNPSTGLGLSHVLDLVSLLKGTIEVNSRTVRNAEQGLAGIPAGTEFRLLIPTRSLLRGGEPV